MTSTQTRHRVGGFGMATGTSHNEQARSSNKTIGGGLGSSTNTWGTGFWGTTPFGSGTKSNTQDAARKENKPFPGTSTAETITGSRSLLTPSPQDEPFPGTSTAETIAGSRSLLPLSASDNAFGRRSHWKSVDETTPGLNASAPRSGVSPDRRQKRYQYNSSAFAENEAADPSFFSMTPMSTSLSRQSSTKNFLDPSSRDFVASGSQGHHLQYSKQNSGEEAPFASNMNGFGIPDPSYAPTGRTLGSTNFSGYNSNVGSRNGSLPPSRNDFEPSSRPRGDVQNLQYARFGGNTSSQRLNTANVPPFIMHTGPSGQRLVEQQSPTQMDSLTGQFEQINVYQARRPSYASSQPSPNSTNGLFPQTYSHDTTSSNQDTNSDYLSIQDQLSPANSASGFPRHNQHRAVLGPQLSHSSNDSDARLSHQSSFYQGGGTPPVFGQQSPYMRNGQTVGSPQSAILDRRLRGLQQQQQGYVAQPNALQYRNQMTYPLDIGPQQQFSMNSLNSYYPVPPPQHLLAGAHVPRGPARDQDMAGHLRSPLLEEFRNNSKTNKRYELKDIYQHIVEFSGDQHGSRFIQQKLETANSDEKDQVFRELHPNARQLMTDVFGNYVIQKFFEHGNQTQKKMLANQMRNHVLTLSTQMYGCRVVQKALEHILTDQQAQLIKELEHDVMRCVKDQNGNHVVQKAIERVPAEHIQFIIHAFHGKVGENATHPYGCRVIQRMLEHCEEPTRSSVLRELHTCASSLINDQYGNYVTQHVIEHGRPEDRGRIIELIISNLVNYSKHKFASNVVEKSVQFGQKAERQRIVRILTLTNERGESPVQMLIRDQYGNYVVQKLLTRLEGQEWLDFADPVKAQVALLKRFSYGKQIASVEKLLYTGQGPHHVQNGGFLPSLDTLGASRDAILHGDCQSPQSSSHLSTHANPLDAATSRKSSSIAYTPNPS